MRQFTVAWLVGVVAAFSVQPAEAQFASPLQILPVVAKVAGAQGTDWRSDMAISNLSDSAVTVGLQFFREARSNTFTGSFAKTITLAAGETRVVEDVLGTLFPSEGNTKGMLLVMAVSGGGADGGMLAVGSRTYNAANPNATYGQSVSPSFVSFIVGLGRSVIPGASWNTRVRTNVGVCNFGPQSAAIVIEIYNGAGALVKSVSTAGRGVLAAPVGPGRPRREQPHRRAGGGPARHCGGWLRPLRLDVHGLDPVRVGAADGVLLEG